jgi:hypothetical protein
MLIRSTGLGRTELEGDVKTLDVKADYIIIGMKTTEPVKWHVRVAANYSDLMTITMLLIFSFQGWKFIIVQFLKSLGRIFTRKKNFVRPDDY